MSDETTHNTNNNKNENMKMRKKLITALVLGACVGTQAFAAPAPAVFQVKQGVINFALTRQYQVQPNTNIFIPAPLVYSTKTAKIATLNVIQIGRASCRER